MSTATSKSAYSVIVEEGHRDPRLGLSVRGGLLESHTGEKILLDDERGGKKGAEQRTSILRPPSRDEIAVEGRCLRVISGVHVERATEHACRLGDRLRDVKLGSDGPDVK